MSELITPYHVDQSWNNDDGVEVATVCDANGVFVLTAFADDVDEILKCINGYEQLQATNQQLVEALTLADAALSGANIDMRQLSKKVNAAITNAKQAMGDKG